MAFSSLVMFRPTTPTYGVDSGIESVDACLVSTTSSSQLITTVYVTEQRLFSKCFVTSNGLRSLAVRFLAKA